MEIIPWDEKYLPDLTNVYPGLYSEKGIVWDSHTAAEHLRKDVRDAPGYSFMAISEEGKCIGAITCRIDPFYTSRMLLINDLFVIPEYQKHGVATELLKTLIGIARKNNISKVHLLVNAKNNFPLSWYEKIGFKRSGWIEMEQEIELISLQ